MKRKLSVTFLVLALGGWLAPSLAGAAASTTIQPPTADSWLGGGSLAVDHNYGGQTTLTVINKQPTNRAVVRFDLSTIPTDAAAKTATLSLWKTAGTSSRNYVAHQITGTTLWVEGTGNDTVLSGTVTWNSRLHGSTLWTTPGGDFNASTSTALTGSSVNVWINWDVLAMVQSWLAGTTNNGILIRDFSEASGGGGVRTDFASKENGTVANRPKLTVTYLRKVTSLTATAGTGQNTLTWVLPGGSPDYNGTLIIRRTDSAFTSTPTDGTVYTAGSSTLADGSLVVFNDTTLATSFTDTGLTNGTTYYYQAFARDSGNLYSFASATVSATPTVVCSAVTDAGYVSANAQNGQATVYWSSATPVVILRKTAAFAGEVPANGASYVAGAAIGLATVVYDSASATAVAGMTCAGTTCTNTGLTNGTTYYYKVFAKASASACYAPGTVNTSAGAVARPTSGAGAPTWSYTLAGGSILKGGTASGSGTLYTTSNASRIVSVSTSDGTQSWAPVATNAPVQAWLTWLPISSPVLVQQQTASVTSAQSLSVTLTSAPGNNRLLVMVGAALNGSLTAGTGVTGGGVATWTLASKSTTNSNVEIWYGITNGSSSTVTISTTVAAGQMWMHVSEWSGMATTGVFDQASAQSGTTSPASAPSITTTNANDLLIFGVGDKLPNTFGTPTPGTWTAMTSISTGFRMQAEWYQVVSTTGAYAPTVSETGLAWDAAIAAFKASGSAAVVIGVDQGTGAANTGRVYSVDPATGLANWQATLTADAFQAGPAAQLRAYANAAFQAAYTDDVVFVATYNTQGTFNTNNKVFALSATTGTVLWTFSPGNMDGIAMMPYVDYGRNRLYVTSRAGSGGGQASIWVINTLNGALITSFSQPSHVDSAPTLSYSGNTLYVGAANGNLYAIDVTPATPVLKWAAPVALGTAVTGFVWEDYTASGRLYFATADGAVRCIQDNGTSGAACAGWTNPSVFVPSAQLVLGSKLFVGSWNAAGASGQKGKIYQINLTTGAVDKTVVVGDGEQQPGDVSSETGSEIFVGTSEGVIYKFPLTGGSL